MDAHDLFRQLTRGAKFTRKRPFEPVSEQESNNASTHIVKQERKIIQNNNNNNINDDSNESEGEESNFQLLEGDDQVTTLPKVLMTNTPTSPEKLLSEERFSILRRDNQITVRGKNIPPPLLMFEDLRTEYDVTEQLVQNVMHYKYKQFTPIQMQAIPVLLKERPLMAEAPTGSGKTLAFLIPVLDALCKRKGVTRVRALVLAPTRELAHQIYRECVQLARKTGLKIHMLSKVANALQDYEKSITAKYHLVVATPNRLRFLLQQERPKLRLNHVEWLIIDEADRLMDEGHDNFKEQIDEIMAVCTNPEKKVAFFSATFTAGLSKWAIRNMKDLVRVTVGQRNSATVSVEQELQFVGSESGKLLAVRDMVRGGLKPPVLIFVQTKDRAKELFNELLYDGINVDIIHADRSQQQRDNCVKAFREGKIWVLICTELMGRGIDFKGVNLVINYDFPPTVISYIHRIGRTGRAGLKGKAITFFTQSDTPNLRSIAYIIRQSGGKVPDFTLELPKPRKSVKKQLANFAPKRESISTAIRPEPLGPSAITHNVKTNGKSESSKQKLQKVSSARHKVLKRKSKEVKQKSEAGCNLLIS